jgi:hypothetical protein
MLHGENHPKPGRQAFARQTWLRKVEGRLMPSTSVPTSQTYRRQPNILSAVIKGELVMMSVETGQYFNLNAVGAHIWRLIEGPQSLDAIVATLADSYDAPEAAIRAEASGFLARLEQENMVVAEDRQDA